MIYGNNSLTDLILFADVITRAKKGAKIVCIMTFHGLCSLQTAESCARDLAVYLGNMMMSYRIRFI